MILYTSLSPSEKSAATQRHCVRSWVTAGHEPIFVQGHGDDISLSLIPEARIERVKPTLGGHQRRPYVGLDALLDVFLASGHERCGIINGDIEIDDPNSLLHRPFTDLQCLRRWDHDGDKERASVFTSGFDMFVLTRAHALAVPRSMFVIGQTWWDYWLPWSCLQAGFRLTTINEPILFHRRHPLNYAHLDWLRTTNHFLWLTGKPAHTPPRKVSGDIHAILTKAVAQ